MKQPSGRSELLAEFKGWARGALAPPLAEDKVPGTSEGERHMLSALGGIVAALLARRSIDDWPDEVQRWVKDGPTPPDALLRLLLAELPAEDDVFAWLYEMIVSGVNRRRLGTFFTPAPVVDFMLDAAQATSARVERVIDAGAGVGAFSLAAAERWPEGEVVGVDVNVVTLGLLACRAALQEHDVRPILADFLAWLPVDSDERPRLIVGNPPYTRHQGLPSALKDDALTATNGLVSSKLAGLSAYFFGVALAHARPDDILCLLLPGNWTEARYGRELRQALWEGNRDVVVTAFPTTAEVFPGTRVTATITCVGRARSRRTTIVLNAASIHSGGVRATELARFRPAEVPPERLGKMLWPRKSSTRRRSTPLRELGTVRRGVATGANHFFFLTDEQASILPQRATVRALRRLRDVSGPVLDTETHDALGKLGLSRWLLWLHDPAVANHRAVRALLESDEATALQDRVLISRREIWYAVEEMAPPNILISTSTKDRLRAVHNDCGVIPSNSMYGIYLGADLDPGAFVEWWLSKHGQQAVLAHARHYAAGLLKLEPNDVLQVMVPPM